MKRLQKILSEWWAEFLLGIIALIYGYLYVRIQSISESNLQDRLAANSLLLDTITLPITAVSILLPATIAIYFYLQHEEKYPHDVVKRFFRAGWLYLLSLLFGLYTASDLPLSSHGRENIVLSTDPYFLVPVVEQFIFLFGGVLENMLGAWAYQRHLVRTNNQRGSRRIQSSIAVD
jgi:hypothetical protein